MDGRKRFRIKSEYVVLLILLVFFGTLLLLFGVQEYPDSETYIRMYLGREPVYPLFLRFLRVVFGDGFKLAAGILQNLLAALSIWLLVCYVRKIFALGRLCTGCVLAFFMAPHLLTPIGSASHMVYTNSILSEGISYSVFNLAVYFLLRLVFEEPKRLRDYAGALCLSVLLALTRGQMLPMLLVWGCVACYAAVTSERGGKWFTPKRVMRCLLVLLVTAASFGARDGLMRAYNYYVKHVDAVTLGGGTTFLTNVVYCADHEDGDGIEDAGVRDTFYYIQEKVEEAGWNYKASGPGMIAQAIHLEDCHDLIKFNQVELFITWYLNDKRGLDGRAREVQSDEVAMEIAGQVLPACLPRWLSVYASLAAVGFIRTVAVVNPLLNWYALAAYLAAALLMLSLFRRNRRSRAALCMLFVSLLICANVFATSMTIMCLSRYMIYNMSFFYTAGLLMLREYVRGGAVPVPIRK